MDPRIDATLDATLPAPAMHTTLALPVRDHKRFERGHEIARGGMARIVAVHDRDLGRDLAVKELRGRGEHLERRFEREVAITARLQHPSIISVIEAGRWESGEPFYVMERVDGRSLDAAIAETSALPQRLALLPHVIAVAEALAYAHRRGVIHRDLKPGNVLVGTFGETIVIDWGLAKRIGDADVAAREVFADGSSEALTVFGHVMGTPAYMPPEQARGQTVDEAADVYAIGAILYHLLTGAMPYEDSRPTSVENLLDLVVEKTPTDVTALEPGVPDDLVAIVRKAMARAPSERYANAADLAADLRRFQTGQLVLAHRYSFGRLLGRWVVRHRAAVVVAAVMLGVLAVGTLVSFARIGRERDAAQTARAAAERDRGEVEGQLDFMLKDLRRKLEPLGKLEVLELVAKRAADYYERRPLDGDAERRAHALTNIGDVMFERGRVSDALLHYDRAIALGLSLGSAREVLGDAYRAAGNVHLERGALDRAIDRYRASLAVFEAMPDRTGDAGAATAHKSIGIVLRKRGELAAALEHYRAALAIAQRMTAPALVDIDHLIATSHAGIGDVLSQRGDKPGALEQFRAALTALERAVAKRPDMPVLERDVAITHSRIGDIVYDQGRYDEAFAHYSAELATAQQLALRDPTNARWQNSLAFAHSRIGDVLEARRDYPGALAEFRTALAIRKRLLVHDTSNLELEEGIALMHHYIGNVLAMSGDHVGAFAELDKALSIRVRLEQTGDARARVALAILHADLGDALRALGKPDEARASYMRCGDVWSRVTSASAPAEAASCYGKAK